jgi:5-methylcytosine-specific restriction protein A
MPLCGFYALPNGFCLAHQNQQRAQSAAVPGTSLRHTARFLRERHYYLLCHPMCATCRIEVATILDHIVPHRGIPRLFWNQSNWQGLCVHCHGVKSARETLHSSF